MELRTDFKKIFKGYKAKNKSVQDVEIDILNLKNWLDASLYLDDLKLKNDTYNVVFEISNRPHDEVHKVKIKFLSTDPSIKNKTLTRTITL